MKPYADNLSKWYGISLTMILEHIVKNKTTLFLILYDNFDEGMDVWRSTDTKLNERYR